MEPRSGAGRLGDCRTRMATSPPSRSSPFLSVPLGFISIDGVRVLPLSRWIRAMHDHNRRRRLLRRIGRRWSLHCRVRVDMGAA